MTASATCVTSLADANIAMVAGATIELCPGTYPVGTPLDQTSTSFAGGIPLIVDVDDVTIKCGISGASANGCILEGGWSQLMIGNPNVVTTSANNLNVSGLTFTGQMETFGNFAPRAVLGTSSSTLMTFTDCLFKDINSTGYVFDFEPDTDVGNAMVVKMVNSAFSNVSHGFDAIYGNANTQIEFNSVSFTNMNHTLPLDNVDKCSTSTAAACGYTSSMIHLVNTVYTTATLAENFVGVTVADSTFYTAILQTLADWGFGTAETFTTLVTVTNTSIYNQTARTANDDYCEGGYAAAYNATTGIDWQCKRVSYALDVVEILRCGINCDANGNFSTLFTALAATGLDTALAGNTAEVTIFAPTDGAFEQLPPGFLDTLIANDTATLAELLQYHVTTEDPVNTEAIAAGLPAALTAMGESVSFTPKTATADYFMVDAAKIIHADWEESPGAGKIIQVIDRVIPPSTITILPSFSQLVESLNLTLFYAAAEAVGFDPNLDSDKIYTLFAPSNGAIENSTTAQALLAAGDKTPLTEMLNHHFVEGNFSMADLQAQGCLDKTSLADLNIKITFSSSEVRWNDLFTNSSVVDQLAYNGILHVVDGVLSTTDIKNCVTSASASTSMSMAFGFAILAMFVF